jgi:hypothetical protein
VGAVDNTDGSWGGDLSDDFPVLLGDAGNPYTPKTHTVYIETIADSIDNQWEMTHFGGLGTATPTSDTDSDGYLDTYEQPPPVGNDTDPNVQDDPDFSDPKYDASTDNRGPYQVVFAESHLWSPLTDPKDKPELHQSLRAKIGTSFNMDVNYFTSNGNQNLSGLELRIHYDSNMLTWNGFSDVLDEGLTSQDTAPQDDTAADYDNDPSTDRYLTIVWSGGDWPGVPCTQASPAGLYVVDFTVAAGLTDGDTSVINFSVPSSDYTFYYSSIGLELGDYPLGDTNMDGQVTPQDAVDCFWISFKTSWRPQEKTVADYNQDGAITPQDAVDTFWASF